MVVPKLDKVAGLIHGHVSGLAHCAHRLLRNATRLRSGGVRSSGRQLTRAQEVVNRLGLVVVAKRLDQARQLLLFFFLSCRQNKVCVSVVCSEAVCVRKGTYVGVAEEELACLDDALGILVQTDGRDAVRVEVGHELLDLLMLVAVLLGSRVHTVLVHHRVDRHFLPSRIQKTTSQTESFLGVASNGRTSASEWTAAS